MLSRRIFGQAAAGAVALLPSAKEGMVGVLNPNQTSIPTPDTPQTERIFNPNKVPLIPHDLARKKAFDLLISDGTLREDAIKSFNNNITMDPSINNKRSWSDAAKITFQRQLYIDRYIEQQKENITNEYQNTTSGRIERLIRKFMWEK